jgi:hypothetical protein
MMTALVALLLALPAAAAQQQAGSGASVPPWMIGVSSTPAAVSTATAFTGATVFSHPTLGHPISLDRGGPWVIGEVLFFSNGIVSTDYTMRDKVRATRGQLYTQSDISADADSLMTTLRFQSVMPSLFEIPNSPVPPELASIAISTSQVRLVFDTVPKVVIVSTQATKIPLPPAGISGLILTPTAYRGTGRFKTPGLALEINAVYVIGRLYGKNSYAASTAHTNYLDRVGLWLLTTDGKMQIQSESKLRPAVAVGAQGTIMFRDVKQPSINTTAGTQSGPSFTVNSKQKNNNFYSNAYFVASKKIGPVYTSAGVLQGNFGSVISQFSEFLSPDSLHFYAGKPFGTMSYSRTMPYLSLFGMPNKNQPLGVEIIRFNGAQLHPMLINFKLGYFLHLNFDLGYLKFDGGYDLLGLLQFRFNYFPRA